MKKQPVKKLDWAKKLRKFEAETEKKVLGELEESLAKLTAAAGKILLKLSQTMGERPSGSGSL